MTREPAGARPTHYPVRLPQSPRRLGGELSVSEAAARLQRFFGMHRWLMRALAGRLIGVVELELKIELSHHLYLHAEACRALRDRIRELSGGSPELSPTLVDLEPLFNEVLAAPSTPDFVLATHVLVGRKLLDAEREHVRRTDPLADQPSVRALTRILGDLQPIVEYGDAVVAAFEEAGWTREPAWAGRVDANLAAIGGIAGDGHRIKAPPPAPPFRRPLECARDARLATSYETRSRVSQRGAAASSETGLERERLHLIRIQRDELDAVETFANVLYDLPEAPFDLQMDLARFIWDEARHAEIGHQALAGLGLDPFEVPCGVLASNVRAPMPPEVAFAQLSSFGEQQILGKIQRFAERAYAAGDRPHAMMFDFIHTDELIHLRHGRAWLRGALSGGDLRGLEERARKAAVKRLAEEGVSVDDFAASLSPADLGRLLGE